MGLNRHFSERFRLTNSLPHVHVQLCYLLLLSARRTTRDHPHSFYPNISKAFFFFFWFLLSSPYIGAGVRRGVKGGKYISPVPALGYCYYYYSSERF